MAFRLVSSGGNIVEPAFVNLLASGTIVTNQSVDFVRTAGIPIAPTTSSSTTTMVFGLAQSYAQGKSDTEVKVIPFIASQLWEVDCANAATTSQVGIRHALSASDRGVIHNTATAATTTGIFEALYMVGSTSGSGKLVGKIIRDDGLAPVNSTTFA